MHEVLVNRVGGLSLPRKSVVKLTDRPDMTLDVYRGHKTTLQQQQQNLSKSKLNFIYNAKVYLLIPNDSVFTTRGSWNSLSEQKKDRLALIPSGAKIIQVIVP